METKITAAIVDDEQGNRENLLRMLGTYCPQIKISAICSSVTEARTVLPEAKPDILFLDTAGRRYRFLPPGKSAGYSF